MVSGVEKRGMPMPNQLLLLTLMLLLMLTPTMVSGVEKRGTLMLNQLLMQMLMLMPMLITDTTDTAVDGEAMEDGEDMVAFTDLMAMDTGERNKRYSPQKW